MQAKDTKDNDKWQTRNENYPATKFFFKKDLYALPILHGQCKVSLQNKDILIQFHNPDIVNLLHLAAKNK